MSEVLIALTKKHARFTWNKECQDSFEQLKTMMTEAPISAYPDPSGVDILYTDASDQCVGALLAQESDDGEKVIHYLSHKLSDSQKKRTTIQKEGFAIVYTLEKLNHYLQGAKFVIRTDHKPLKYLFSAEMKNRKIQMWAIKISAYNCSTEYLEGRKNTHADKSAETIANIILDELIPRHSCPVTIVKDNGAEFKNSVMDTLCQNLNIKHIFTSTYHPKGNGKTERFHRVMNDMLSKQASDRLERWDLSLPQVLGVSDSTQYAPFFLLYTRDPVQSFTSQEEVLG